MLNRMLKAWLAVGKSFHQWIPPLFTFANLLVHHCVVTVAMGLDHLFYPSLRKVRIEKPIVIVGNPRSGTTFLQRFLVKNGLGAGMRVWKMIYPSLLQQALIRPLLPLMEKFSPTRHHAKAAHDTSLTSVETDDPATLFRYFDGFFLYGFLMAWADEDPIAMFAPENRDTSHRDFTWYRKIWRRNLAGEKQDRVVAKLFSLGIRLPQFLAHFPDARILYMIRDPRSTVPSGMSLVTGVLDQRFKFWSMPEEKRNRYLKRLYSAFLDLSMRFTNDYAAGKFPKESLMVVPYHRMMSDFDGLMKEILAFVDVKPSGALTAQIKETADKQRQYKSGHKYDLEKFGLTEEQIMKDYEPVFRTFGIPVE
ncbi:sulfotransferase [bacterium]|nr:sulfotransferase [bacterium]